MSARRPLGAPPQTLSLKDRVIKAAVTVFDVHQIARELQADIDEVTALYNANAPVIAQLRKLYAR
jgi:hypothetical protein